MVTSNVHANTGENVEFLSDAWFAARAAQLRTCAVPTEARDLTISIRQIITTQAGIAIGTETETAALANSTISFVIHVSDGTVTLIRDGTLDPAPADIVFRTDRSTAHAIHDGTLPAHAAISAGRLHVSGELQRVLDPRMSFLGVFGEGTPGL